MKVAEVWHMNSEAHAHLRKRHLQSIPATLYPEEGCGNDPHTTVTRPSFLVARRQPTELLEPVDQPLHAVALSVDGSIKRSCLLLVFPPRERLPDTLSPQISATFSAAVARVAHHTLRAQFRSPPAWPLDCSLLHHLLKDGAFMLLTWCEQNGHRLAIALYSQMDLGTKASLAAPESLGLWVPFFAPAACW
jgi:hypothetical protein